MFLVAGLAVAGLVGIAAAFYFSIRSGNRGDKRLRSAGAGRAGTGRRPGSRSGTARPDLAGHPAGPPAAAGRPPRSRPPGLVQEFPRRGRHRARSRPRRRPGARRQPQSRSGRGRRDRAGRHRRRTRGRATPRPRIPGRMTHGPTTHATRPTRTAADGATSRPGRPGRAAAWGSAREPTSMRSCGRRRRSAASATSSSGTTWRRTSRSPRPRVRPSRTHRARTGRLAARPLPGSTRDRPPTRRPSRPRRDDRKRDDRDPGRGRRASGSGAHAAAPRTGPDPAAERTAIQPAYAATQPVQSMKSQLPGATQPVRVAASTSQPRGDRQPAGASSAGRAREASRERPPPSRPKRVGGGRAAPRRTR